MAGQWPRFPCCFFSVVKRPRDNRKRRDSVSFRRQWHKVRCAFERMGASRLKLPLLEKLSASHKGREPSSHRSGNRRCKSALTLFFSRRLSPFLSSEDWNWVRPLLGGVKPNPWPGKSFVRLRLVSGCRRNTRLCYSCWIGNGCSKFIVVCT